MTTAPRSLLSLPKVLPFSLIQNGPSNGTWHWDSAGPIHVEAEFPITHAEPTAVAALAAWAEYQAQRGVEVVIDDSVKSPRAFQTGVLSALARRLDRAPASANVVAPVRVRDMDEQKDFLRRVGGALGLKYKADALDAVQYALSELMRNVSEHAQSELGAFVSAAHVVNSDRVTIAVADVGIGIPGSIRAHALPEADDRAALQAALQWGVTGASGDAMYGTRDNAGKGLTISREFASRTGGMFAIRTLGAIAFSDSRNSQEEPVTVDNANVPWQGTVVTLSFRPGHVGDFKFLVEDMGQRYSSPPAPARDATARFAKGAPPEGVIVARIHPDVGRFAQDKDAAIAARETVIGPALERGDAVHIDFEGVHITTQSLVHALIYSAIASRGAAALEQITFHRAAHQVKSLVNLVAGYALTERESRE